MLDKRTLIISILFNIYWFLCVCIQNKALLALAGIYIAAIIYDNSVFLSSLLIASIGVVVDSVFTALGFFVFDASANSSFISDFSAIPVWLYFLWLGFANYLWLMRDFVIEHLHLPQTVIVGVSGASSYFAAYKLGAVSFSEAVFLTLIILFAVWTFYGWLFAAIIRSLSKRYFNEVGKLF